jgi:CubicO group peptidase (beta-lactamase class C family)
MLIGAAIEDGYIASVDDRIGDYLPRLAGSEYADVTIEHILQMASGVAWNEDYTDPDSDVSRAGALNGLALTAHLAELGRADPAGEAFNYNTGEANLVGEVLRAAIGNNAST